ncbi:MAG: MerR family transcriptional regulator [Coprobacillaceae bacterium]
MKRKLRDNDIDKFDLDNLDKTYKTGELSKSIGTTSDTLRYYEEIGLIEPVKDENNMYRQFTFTEIYHMFGIEFYKKRGLSLSEIKNIVSGASIKQTAEMLDDSEKRVKEEMKDLKKKLQRIQETKQFCKNIEASLGTFIVKDMPLYQINSTFTAGTALYEYEDNVLAHLNLEEEDVISNMVRKLIFDGEGYKESNMHLVTPVSKKKKNETYLHEGKCISVVVESGRYNDADSSISLKTLERTFMYSKENNIQLLGEVYLFMRTILFKDGKERVFIEALVPIQE